jgi:hypothetical protein
VFNSSAVLAGCEDARTHGIVGAPPVRADETFLDEALQDVAHICGAVDVVLAVMEQVDVDVVGL